MNGSYVGISYVAPLRRAWERAHRMLFRPFTLRTWLVLGFAAFLSEAITHGSGLGSSYQMDEGRGPGVVFRGVRGLLAGLVVAGIGMVLVAAIAILLILLLWVNSRGRFVFLDDVVRERAAVVEPWKRLGRSGQSLFVWTIGFVFVCLAIATLLALPFLASLAALWGEGGFEWRLLGALWVLLAAGIPFGIGVAATLLYLSDFVIPIMYRHGLSAMAAWGRFIALFRAHTASFVVYALFVFGLWIVVGALLTVIGVSTCCLGFVLFGLPYVSSVVLLPVLVTFRGLGPEFLAQFGPEYSVFVAAPGPVQAAGGTQPAPSAPGAAPGAGA
jgi:hypothetical protein